MTNTIATIASFSTSIKNFYDVIHNVRIALKQNKRLTSDQLRRIENAYAGIIALERQNTICYLTTNKLKCLASTYEQFMYYKDTCLAKILLYDMEKLARRLDEVIDDYMKTTRPVKTKMLPYYL